MTDLQSAGFGATWQHKRAYSNQLSGDEDVGQGYNWLVSDWPYAIESGSGTVAIVRSTTGSMWFEPTMGGYVGLYGTKSTLTHDTTNHLFIVSMPDGTRMEFHDFDQGTYPLGLLSRQIEAGGDVTAVHSYSGDRITEIRRSGTVGGQPLTEAFVYAYDAAKRITSVTLRRQLGSSGWEDVLRAVYEYFDGAEDFGSQGDLKRVRRQVPTDSGWADQEITYYRYYVEDEEDGFIHGLKFVVEPATYAKMIAAAQNPLTASDALLATYADKYFEYDADDRVTLERIDGGSRTFTLEYTESGFADGPNTWKARTVETKPDGSQNVVYTNFLGQSLLFVLRVPGSDPNWKRLSLDEWDALSLDEWSELDLTGPQEWANHTQYDDNNRPVLFAYPSAIVGYDDTEPDLDVKFRTNAGLLELTEYYDTTSSGAADGYVSARKIRNGSAGTDVLLQTLEYSSQTAGGTTVYPVSKTTSYRNDNGTGAIETGYSYTYHSGTTQIEIRTTTWPVIPTDQNGSGVAATRKDYFDINGRNTWSMDERGYITNRVYDLGTGALAQLVDDVDTSVVSGAPTGWTTPPDGGLNLVTDYLSDDQGRMIQVLGPLHTIDIGGTATAIRRATWMVYDDVDHVTYSGNGYESGTSPSFDYTLINPVSITKRDAGGKVLEQIQAVSSETEGTLADIITDAGGGSEAFPQSSYCRWTTTQYIDCCLAVSQRVYHMIPASGIGTEGTNYDKTDYGYDIMKRRTRTVTPGGTITWTVFDIRGLPQSVWVGTNDDGATASDPAGNRADPDNNMVVVTSNVYDDDEPRRDGNLTRQVRHVSPTEARVTEFTYDWRNRQVDIDGEIDVFQRVAYDNLDQLVMTRRYNTNNAGNLLAQSETKFDDRGRVFRSIRYSVDPATGTVGNGLVSNTWYSDIGYPIKSLPAGSQLFTKVLYDGLGRPIAEHMGYDLDESLYADTISVLDDTIIEQSETLYDDASNVIKKVMRQRYHNAPATQTGPLEDPVHDPKARVTFTATYPDALGRAQAAAYYGTNGGAALARSATIPTPSDDILVSFTAWGDAGDMLSTTDPSGMVTRMGYDDVGRVVEQVQNYQSSSSSSSSSSGCGQPDDINVTVQTSYNADGNMATLTAINSQTGNQVTTYIYGTTLDDSGVATSTLRRKEIYPDAAYDEDVVTITYNRQSQITTRRDQNGTVHSYDYDALGRMTQDRITTVGDGIDNIVLRIGLTYEARGLREKVTSYDNAAVGAGNVLNEVQSEYNGFGQLVTEYQAHGGAVNTLATLKVQYEYANGSVNTIRPEALVYPSGRMLTYSYGATGSLSDASSRIEAIMDDDDMHLVEYEYLGRGLFVVANDAEPQVKWTLVDLTETNDPDTGDIYSGLDRFGRIKGNRWYNYDVEEDIDRLQYGYDRASNRLWRANLVARSSDKEFDELYTYDGLHRLRTMGRGLLNGTQTVLTSRTFAQCWTLDSTGNWSGMKEADTGGSWTLEQNRTASVVNEITDITNTVGAAWAQPVYDPAGNMTVMPRPNNPTDAVRMTYDAWGRMVSVSDAESRVSDYQYDGLRRNISQREYSAGVPGEARHIYFTTYWQELEDRIGNSPTANQQFVWGLRYIDDVTLRDRDGDNDGEIDERLYVSQDAGWNVTALFSRGGVAQERYAYAAYGVPRCLSPSFEIRSASAFAWSRLFSGRPRDIHSYQFRTRQLAEQVGTFTARDLIRYVGGSNLYIASFVVNYVDPLGLEQQQYDPDEWYNYYILPRLGPLNPEWLDDYKRQFDRGCVGVTMVVSGQHPHSNFPDLSNCYTNLAAAAQAKEQWDKEDRCCKSLRPGCPCQTIFGTKPRARLINVQFGDDGRDLGKGNGGIYDLNPHEDIIGDSAPGDMNFDFVIWSEPLKKWVHANHCQPGMKVKHSDTEDVINQFNNTSAFNRMFYCVICEGTAG